MCTRAAPYLCSSRGSRERVHPSPRGRVRDDDPVDARVVISLCMVLSLVLAARTPCQAMADSRDRPRFCFGVIADVQYADKAAGGSREYRAALPRLASSVASLNQHRLAFVVNLGDLIDGNGEKSTTELRQVTDVLERLRVPWHHVIGNHCLEVERPALMRALRLKRSWYEFRHKGWRFLVLDGMDVSVKAPAGSPNALAAAEYRLRNPKLAAYNGAVGPQQLDWLRKRLAAAASAQEHVIVLCHHPVLPASSNLSLVLWNWEEVLSVVTRAGCVVAWLNGHDHRGGYARYAGVHFVSFPGLVESAGNGPCYGVVEAFDNQLVIQGTGSVPTRTLTIAYPRAAPPARRSTYRIPLQ